MEPLESCVRRGRDAHAVVRHLERALHDAQHCGFIVHASDVATEAAQDWAARGGFARMQRRARVRWKVDFERGAFARFAAQSQVAAMTRDDTVHDRETEPGALAERLCREEGLEYAASHTLGHADTLVAHGEASVVTGGRCCAALGLRTLDTNPVDA